MAADPQGMQDLIKAAYAGGIVILTALAGAVARKIFNPNAGPSDRLSRLEQRVDMLELRLNSMTSYRDRWRYLCLEARLMVENLAAKHGLVLEPWPDDPEEPLINPPGDKP